jgi:hypothetical protein
MGHTTLTDSRSQRIRASRRGGQILTRARSSSYVTGLPNLRAPRCPSPGWSHHSASHVAMTETDGTAPFIPDTNVIERLNGEFRRRIKTQGAQPTEDAAVILLFSLVASGQIVLRRIDGWQRIAAVLTQRTRVAA